MYNFYCYYMFSTANIGGRLPINGDQVFLLWKINTFFLQCSGPQSVEENDGDNQSQRSADPPVSRSNLCQYYNNIYLCQMTHGLF